MDKRTHRIRKKLFSFLVALFLTAVVLIPSSPVMEHPGVRSSVTMISSIGDQGTEEKVDPEEDPGREEARSVEDAVVGSGS